MKDTFIALLREAGNGSHEITVPHKLIKFLGLKKGDLVKVLVEEDKKQKEESVSISI